MNCIVFQHVLGYIDCVKYKFKISEENVGVRIDKFLVKVIPHISRSQIQKLFTDGLCLVNGDVVKKSYVLALSDVVFVKSLDVKKDEVAMPNAVLRFVCKSSDYLVLDKPPGIAVHGEHSIVSPLSKLLSDDFLDRERPGIVHRLDKQTSGCLLVARNQKSLEYFQKQFKCRIVKKFYFALVKGHLPHSQGIIDSPIGRDLHDRKRMAISSQFSGKVAISKFKVIHEYFDCSLVEIELFTGRTHQIRVHMQAIGHPVIGDSVYGERNLNEKFKNGFGLNRQFLHAHRLEFSDLKRKRIKAVSPLPEDLQSVLDKMKD